MIKAVTTLMADGANFQVVAERVPKAVVDEIPHEPMLVDLQLEKIQENIAQKIGLYNESWKNKSLQEKARDIFKILSKKKIVLWKFKVKCLTVEEAWKLFQNKIGEDTLNTHLVILELAKSVAQECGGLPLALITIGRAMAYKKTPEEWNYAIQVLKRSASEFPADVEYLNELSLGFDVLEELKINCARKTMRKPGNCFKIRLERTLLTVIQIFLSDAAAACALDYLERTDCSKLKLCAGETKRGMEVNAKEYGGLPLALITIGRAMACKKTPAEWKYAIQVLSRSAYEFPGMGKEVYPLLKFSYDSLPSKIVRSCLLYCSLFPEDYSIPKKHLIDCWIGEGFLNDDDGGGTQNQGHHLIGVLLHACLLEEEDDDFVKMHDVIRDMTLWISCEIEKEKENYLVRVGTGLTEAPEIFKWIGIRRISLMENQINSLSISGIATFPHLLTLFLNRNDLSLITSGIFDYMSSLRVLNLSTNDSLRELPAEISKLVSLQYLDISETAIKELPKEFKALNVQLWFSVSRERECSFGGSEYLVEELLDLKHLNTLSITLKSSQAVEKFLSSYKLQSATQSLCLQYFDNSKSLNVSSLAGMKSLDALSIWNCKHLEELKIGSVGEVEKILEIHAFHNLVAVHIDCCLKLRDLTWLIFAPNVKKNVISSCYEMEEIISAEKLGEVPEMVRNQKPFCKTPVYEIASFA
ncbi:hypothetical protein EZV62_004138 [Acer yangbiense]|uniref:NB-ARC domain-containing protein n=1 Tax=Acer yangbiense TaxID=1000413 RepID=A0A5C7IIW4_9ROSI|nr:hypothetical protein EZV62_004138 [Acer yangbiense]